jgi:hypothetical protein
MTAMLGVAVIPRQLAACVLVILDAVALKAGVVGEVEVVVHGDQL